MFSTGLCQPGYYRLPNNQCAVAPAVCPTYTNQPHDDFPVESLHRLLTISRLFGAPSSRERSRRRLGSALPRPAALDSSRSREAPRAGCGSCVPFDVRHLQLVATEPRVPDTTAPLDLRGALRTAMWRRPTDARARRVTSRRRGSPPPRWGALSMSRFRPQAKQDLLLCALFDGPGAIC